MPLYIENINPNISPRENYLVTSGYETNPIAMFGTGFMGLSLIEGDLEVISLINGMMGMRSIGSFCNYRLVYDLFVPFGTAMGNMDVDLTNLYGSTLYFKFYESLQGYPPISPPNGNLASNGWHYSYVFGNTTPINLFPTNPSTNTAFTTQRMTPNPLMEANADIIGDCYICFQVYPNTSPYVNTSTPQYAGKIVRVYIYRESLILEDFRNQIFNDNTQNFQINKFLRSNRNQPILDLPTTNQDHFTDLGLNYAFGGDLFIINPDKLNGDTITSSDWLYGRSVALNNFNARSLGFNWEYEIKQGDQKSFYFNQDRNDNPILNTFDVISIGTPELKIISSNTTTNAISPFERLRFTGTFQFPGLNSSRFPKGTLQINSPGNTTFFDYIHVFLLRTKTNPTNLISNTKRVENWGSRDSVIVDSFCYYDPSNGILKGTYGDYSTPLPYTDLPTWFTSYLDSNNSDIFYGPLVLDDLSNLGSNKIKIQFDIDPVGKLVPTGTLELNEQYRILLVFQVSKFEGNSGDPILGVNYSSNVPGSTYSWLSEAYPLIVNNDDPDPPDDPNDPNDPRDPPDPPRPTIRTCLPDLCSFIEDYNGQYPDNLEVAPLDRIRSNCTFFSERFDRCRVLQGNPNGNHHFESGITKVSVRVYWDEINGNDVIRHVLDQRQKAPSNLGPNFPYVGDIDFNVSQTLYNPNTGEYGRIQMSAEYRIRDEKSVLNLQSYQVNTDGSEVALGSRSNQDWTNKTIYIEYRVDVSFSAYNQPISDTFIKRQVLRVLDFDSNKPEVSRTLRLKLVDGTGPNENEIYAIVDGDGDLYVRAEQIINDDDVLVNPLDPVERDYHIALLRNTPIGNNTTSEWDNYGPNNLTKLTQADLISANSQFSTGLIPKAYGGFNTDAFDRSLEYEYACIKKKPVQPLSNCDQSLSLSGGPGVYYYPYRIGNITDAKRWVVVSYEMYSLVDGLRFSLNSVPKFWTKSGDPYTYNEIIGGVLFDLSSYLTGAYTSTNFQIVQLEDGGNCGYVSCFNFTFYNSLPYDDQLVNWVDCINNTSQALEGRFKAFKVPGALVLQIVFYDGGIANCCGLNYDWTVIQQSGPTFNLTSQITCCGPNDPLNENDFGVVPELVQGRGIFAYELPLTNCLQLGELLITSPSCHRGNINTSTAWEVTAPCPMEVLPLSTLLNSLTDIRFQGVTNGIYGFLVDSPDSFPVPWNLGITTTGTGIIEVYAQENDYSTFNLPVGTGVLGTSFVATRPAYNNLNCPYWLILIKSTSPWTFTAS